MALEYLSARMESLRRRSMCALDIRVFQGRQDSSGTPSSESVDDVIQECRKTRDFKS
jgi:hypothetical protein